MNFKQKMSDFTGYVSYITGDPLGLILAFLFVLVWGLTGPLFGFSDTWQLVINTITNVVALLMAFVIQNTQNRDGEAIQIKLDELIRSHGGAHDAVLDIEELTQEQLKALKARYKQLAAAARADLLKGLKDTSTKDISSATKKTSRKKTPSKPD
jgi:low affinity Fe/Cu permease